jgi:hypothetical protein
VDNRIKSLFYYDLVTIVLGHDLQGVTGREKILVRIFAYLQSYGFFEDECIEISGFGL